MERDVALAPFTTLGIGGAARWFVRAGSIADVAAAHHWATDRRLPLFVLGGGSNLVVADEGFEGLVVQVGLRGLEFAPARDDTILCAAAGEAWDAIVQAAVERGLAGVECLSGIPGSAGGTPVQNVGAYGQEVGDTIEHVTVFDREAASIARLPNAACGFAYRMSRFKSSDAGRFIVLDVSFRLRPGPPTTTYPDVIRYLDQHAIATPTVADARAAVLDIRRRKGMVIDPADPDTRSVGSFFMNPIVAAAPEGAPSFAQPGDGVKVPAAWLIERTGFAKGFSAGRVGLSTRHPLAIVNRGGATARDVVDFAVRIKRRVLEQFGIALRPEPMFVGFGDDADVRFLQKAE